MITFTGYYCAMGDYGRTSANISIFSNYIWAMGSLERNIYSGNAICVHRDLVAWHTRKQADVTLSSTEAEHIALSYSCKECLNILHFMNRFVHVKLAIYVLMDKVRCT